MLLLLLLLVSLFIVVVVESSSGLGYVVRFEGMVPALRIGVVSEKGAESSGVVAAATFELTFDFST